MCEKVRSRLEINIRRLLEQCEKLAKEDLIDDWKLEMYIESLQDMIEKLQAHPGKPCRDEMVRYIRRVEFLKGFLNTKKLTNPVERAVAAQLLPTNIVSSSESIDGPSITSQIHQKTTAKYGQEIRDELFQLTRAGENDRQKLLGSSDGDLDLDSRLKRDRETQEKIAEEMIHMVRSMKEHALSANTIIRRDVASLEKSDHLTDVNTVKLKKESAKLEEHTKSSWRCWLWLMLAFVIVIFLNMVLFMRVMKKRKIE